MREEVVAAQLAAVQAAEVEALKAGLGACYDQGLADAQPGTVEGTFKQEDLDKAVADAKAADAQAMADLKAQSDAAAADLQKKLEEAVSKELAEESVISALKESADKLQAAVDAIHALFPMPAPAAPAPEAPVDAAPAQ